MMKILIIGKNSYIGDHIDEWLSHKGYEVRLLDVLYEDWRSFNYSYFDSIVHVAGIVHRPDCNDWNLYRTVNAEMPVEIAKIAKEQGVKQYVFFSTMGVYGIEKKLGVSVIDEDTPLCAEGMYGKSKLMAEKELEKLSDGCFKVAIVRPPSVYGKGCRGGYITGFASIAKLLPIIPRAYSEARQSFIYIDNLCECVYLIVRNHLSGAFCPQDDEIPNANELFEAISKGLNRKYRDSRFLGILMQWVSFVPLVKKAYGGIQYSRKLSDREGFDYVIVPFKEAMRRTISPD